MNKKKVISIILLLIGIFIIIYAFVIYKNNDIPNNKSPNDSYIEMNEYNENSIIKISEFYVQKIDENNIKIKFSLENQKNKNFKSQMMYLNFYQNNKIIYTYEYTIPDLASFDMVTAETVLDLNIQDISKYEFIIQNQKIVKIPDSLS